MRQGKALYVTYEETYFKMTTFEWVEVAELQSTQEEADTRLLLHALHAARTGSKAVIVTPEDNDVMLLYFACQKGYPLSHLSEVRDTEPHAICRYQQTGLVVGRQRL